MRRAGVEILAGGINHDRTAAFRSNNGPGRSPVQNPDADYDQSNRDWIAASRSSTISRA
jgi:hypothetical protein